MRYICRYVIFFFPFRKLVVNNFAYCCGREEEGIKLMKQMKKRYSATISETMKAMIQNGDDTSVDLVICFMY